VAKIRRIVCISCGNTEEFIVDSTRNCVGATLRFNEDGSAELDDSFAQDVDIFPGHCAICGAEIGYDATYSQPKSGVFGWILDKKNEAVCNKCERRFECFTERNGDKPCLGFRFKEEFAEVE